MSSQSKVLEDQFNIKQLCHQPISNMIEWKFDDNQASIKTEGENVGNDELDRKLQESIMVSVFKLGHEIVKVPKAESDMVTNHSEDDCNPICASIKLECDVENTIVEHEQFRSVSLKCPSITQCFIKSEAIKNELALSNTSLNYVNKCEKQLDVIYHPFKNLPRHDVNSAERNNVDAVIEDTIVERSDKLGAQGKSHIKSFANSAPNNIIFDGSMKGQTAEKFYNCDICQYRSTYKSNLNRHMRDHTGQKPFKCGICEYRSTSNSSLIVHMRGHTGEKPFKCNICQYTSSYKSSVTVHMRTHTGEKPFKCNTCEDLFSHRSHLAVHMKTHTGETPFKCDTCEYRTIYKCALTVHVRSHTGEKPFKCGFCDYKSSHRSHLTVHMRTHVGGEKPFKCVICKYKTSRKFQLKMHVRIHTRERPYKCGICDRKFSQKCSLRVHMRTMHLTIHN